MQVEDLDIKSSAIEHERAALDKNVNSLAEKVPPGMRMDNCDAISSLD